jgi:hypothetical protein
MKYAITYLQAGAGILCLSFALAIHAHAVSSDVYLDASASASSVQELDTSLELKADATTSQGTNQELDSNVQTSSADAGSSGSAGSAWWSFFQSKATASSSWEPNTGFWAGLMSLLHLNVPLGGMGTSTHAAYASMQTLANARIQDVGATYATVSWSPSEFRSVSVYYATSSPVVAEPSTAHVSPWKFWNWSSAKLKGLAPDTTYFYKVVAETDFGTTTTTEGSFRTLSN